MTPPPALLPDIADPSTFAARAQAWVLWQSIWYAELAAIIGVTIPAGSAAAGTLTGNTLAANVLNSSLTSLGTLVALALGSGAKFTSAPQAITAAGLLTLAHGLSAPPTLFQLRLKCTSAELNYGVNDEIVIQIGPFSSATVNSIGVSVVPDATNLNIRYGSNIDVFYYLDKTTGGLVPLTNTKWQAIFRAWVL